MCVKNVDKKHFFRWQSTNFNPGKHPGTAGTPRSRGGTGLRPNARLMTKEGTLLVVDDNRSILAALQLLLGNHFERVLTLPSPNQLISTCAGSRWTSCCST